MSMVKLPDDTTGAKAPVDITRLLYTNYPPDDVEKQAVRREIDMLKSAISMKTSRTQLDELEDRMARCQSVLAPIRRVPQEIIGEILIWTLDVLSPEYETRIGDILRLALVCKMWNDEARKSSHWSELRIPISSSSPGIPTCEEVGRRFKVLRKVTIDDTGDCQCLRRADKDTCLLGKSAFIQILSRYTSLRSTGLSLSCIGCFGNLMQSIKPGEEAQRTWLSVRTLTLKIKAFQQLRRTGELQDNFNLSNLPPSLTSLSLSLPTPAFRNTGPRAVRFKLPPHELQSLTSLDLCCDWGNNLVLDMLRLSPNLHSLRLDGKLLKVSPGWKGDAIELELPRLHTLDVSMSLSAAGELLPRLVLPALVDVRIGVHEDREMFRKLNCIKAFSSGMAPAPTLRSLTVYSIPSQGTYRTKPSTTSEREVVGTLSAIPSLQYVTLKGLCFNSGRFLELLEPKIGWGSQDFLPEVRSMEIIDPIGLFEICSFLQYVKLRHQRAQHSDSLLRIMFGFRKAASDLNLEFGSPAYEWELALKTIESLKNSYGVVVDRVFLSA